MTNNPRSKVGVEGRFARAVDRAHHPREVLHADVKSSGLAEHTVVEGFLVLLGVSRRITNGIAVLFVGVAAPHAVNDWLAGKEVVSVLG